MTVKSKLKYFIAKCTPPQIRHYYQGVATILVYHKLTLQTPSAVSFRPNLPLAVHVDKFEEQLDYFVNNYNCISLDELYQGLLNNDLPERALVLTFDDGYLDNFELALPLLERYKVPATIYITTGLIDGKLTMWWYELEQRIRANSQLDFKWQGEDFSFPIKSIAQKCRVYENLNYIMKNLDDVGQNELSAILSASMPRKYSVDALPLSRENLLQLAASPYVTIGAHTLTHPNLRLCSEERAEHEMSASTKLLEEYLGKKISHFSYPYGELEYAAQREFEMAEKLGFKTACTTRIAHVQREHREALLSLPRIPVSYFDDMPLLKWKLSGDYAMISQRGSRMPGL